MKKTLFNHKLVWLCVLASVAVALKVTADCQYPTDFGESGDCAPTTTTHNGYPTCDDVSYSPTTRNECEPSSPGVTDCQNHIVEIVEIHNHSTPQTLYGHNVCGSPTWTESKVIGLCIQGIGGGSSCP
jgi:hypothetical protein